MPCSDARHAMNLLLVFAPGHAPHFQGPVFAVSGASFLFPPPLILRPRAPDLERGTGRGLLSYPPHRSRPGPKFHAPAPRVRCGTGREIFALPRPEANTIPSVTCVALRSAWSGPWGNMANRTIAVIGYRFTTGALWRSTGDLLVYGTYCMLLVRASDTEAFGGPSWAVGF